MKLHNMSTFELRTWGMQSPEKNNFPEQRMRISKARSNGIKIGLAVSGGGSRAFALTAGYLRGLTQLDKMKEVGYISSVSGGSWATSIFTFARPQSADQETNFDQWLLGEPMQPEQLSLQFLRTAMSGHLTLVVTKFYGVLTAFKLYFQGVERHKLWQRMIGDCILRPFNLQKKVMAPTEEQKRIILKQFPTLKEDEVVLPMTQRPFWIANATLEGPKGYSTGWGVSLQFSSLYAGVPYYGLFKQMAYTPISCDGNVRSIFIKAPDLGELYTTQMVRSEDYPTGTIRLVVGGGLMDSYAFGVSQLKDESSYFPPENGEAKVLAEKTSLPQPFYIEDAIGASSAAYVAGFQNAGFWYPVQPRSDYFPFLNKNIDVLSHPNMPVTREMSLGDGGNYDNTGLLPLLQRGVQKCICLINSAESIDLNYTKNVFISEVRNPRNPRAFKNLKDHAGQYYSADTQLLSLFQDVLKEIKSGYNYTLNAVFKREELDPIMQQLIKNVKDGHGAICRRQMEVQENAVWNIKGGWKADILFIYNEHVRDFENALDAGTKDALKTKEGEFENYPFYNTTYQGSRPFSLTRAEVTLLSAQAEYIIKNLHKVPGVGDFFD